MLPINWLDPKTWIITALGIVVAVGGTFCGIYIWSLSSQLESAQKEKGKLVVENSALRTANTQFAADLKAQKQSIDAIKSAQEVSSKAADVAMRSAASLASQLTVQAGKLRDQKPTGSFEQDCRLLDTNLNDDIKGRMK